MCFQGYLMHANVLPPPIFMAHEPQIPSRQDLRKVRVGSTSFLILISASSTIGPQLIIKTCTLCNLYVTGLCLKSLRVQINFVSLHCRFLSSLVGIPSINSELLDSRSYSWFCCSGCSSGYSCGAMDIT